MGHSADRDAKWTSAWYGNKRWVYALLPLEGLFRLVAYWRRAFIVRWRQVNVGVPVIVFQSHPARAKRGMSRLAFGALPVVRFVSMPTAWLPPEY